jgi:hypothetical protein
VRWARINADCQLGDVHGLVKTKAEEMCGVGLWMIGAVKAQAVLA